MTTAFVLGRYDPPFLLGRLWSHFPKTTPEKGMVRGSALNGLSVRNATQVVQEHLTDGVVSLGEPPAVETET